MPTSKIAALRQRCVSLGGEQQQHQPCLLGLRAFRYLPFRWVLCKQAYSKYTCPNTQEAHSATDPEPHVQSTDQTQPSALQQHTPREHYSLLVYDTHKLHPHKQSASVRLFATSRKRHTHPLLCVQRSNRGGTSSSTSTSRAGTSFMFTSRECVCNKLVQPNDEFCHTI